MRRPKQYGVNGLAGCVTQRKTRKGIFVGLYHAEQAELDIDPESRWVTVCEEHGSILAHPSLRLAHEWLPRPEEWCEDCRGGDDE
jgi:hypothetical protein